MPGPDRAPASWPTSPGISRPPTATSTWACSARCCTRRSSWTGLCRNSAQVLDWYRALLAEGTVATVHSVEVDRDAVCSGSPSAARPKEPGPRRRSSSTRSSPSTAPMIVEHPRLPRPPQRAYPRPIAGRRLCRHPASRPGPVGRLHGRSAARAGQDVRAVDPLLDRANHGRQPRDVGIGDAGKESLRHRLVDRAVRPVEEGNHGGLGCWPPCSRWSSRSSSQAAARAVSRSRHRALRRRRRAGARAGRRRGASGRRCPATWRKAPSAGTA